MEGRLKKNINGNPWMDPSLEVCFDPKPSSKLGQSVSILELVVQI